MDREGTAANREFERRIEGVLQDMRERLPAIEQLLQPPKRQPETGTPRLKGDDLGASQRREIEAAKQGR
ncbi:MAG: hypothetical protein WA005_17640 [Candidatus Binataceae bacterium]